MSLKSWSKRLAQALLASVLLVAAVAATSRMPESTAAQEDALAEIPLPAYFQTAGAAASR